MTYVKLIEAKMLINDLKSEAILIFIEQILVKYFVSFIKVLSKQAYFLLN